MEEVPGELGEKVYTHPETIFGLQFKKTINTTTKKAEYSIYFNEISSKVAEKGFGVEITLENSQKISRPKALVVMRNSSFYNSSITLTTAEMNLLKTHKIRMFKLIEHEGTLTSEESWVLRGVIECLLTKN